MSDDDGRQPLEPGVYDEASLYAAAFGGPVDEEVDWLLALCPARSVVEPFCGQARFALAFRERGVEYIGVDRSAEMLALAPRGPGITLLESDVTRFDLGRRVELAWCPINSLCHLDAEPAIAAHLACVGRHLEPGAAYVIEVELVRHDGPWRTGPADRSVWMVEQPDGSVVDAHVERRDCDLPRRTCTEWARYRRRRGDRVVAEAAELFTMRMWTFDDLLRLARDAGFTVERAFRNDGPRGRPEVAVDARLENDGANHYFVLRRA